MSDSPVVDWNTLVHKDVRSKDGGDVGIVDAIDEDSIVIGTTGPRGEYKLPKSEVESFNGVEVSLRSSLAKLEKYKV